MAWLTIGSRQKRLGDHLPDAAPTPPSNTPADDTGETADVDIFAYLDAGAPVNEGEIINHGKIIYLDYLRLHNPGQRMYFYVQPAVPETVFFNLYHGFNIRFQQGHGLIETMYLNRYLDNVSVTKKMILTSYNDELFMQSRVAKYMVPGSRGSAGGFISGWVLSRCSKK